MLSVTHGPSVPGGLFEHEVEERGTRSSAGWCRTARPPGSADAFDAVLAFGGSMHPDEDDRFGWLETEEEFLRNVLEDGVPALGVCLGAQMLARAAGSPVGPAPEPEIGWLEVELTAAGRDDPVLGVLPARFDAFQWHQYTFAVPAGGAELASSDVCAQAFRVGGRVGAPVPRRGDPLDDPGLGGRGRRRASLPRGRAPRGDHAEDRRLERARPPAVLRLSRRRRRRRVRRVT